MFFFGVGGELMPMIISLQESCTFALCPGGIEVAHAASHPHNDYFWVFLQSFMILDG